MWGKFWVCLILEKHFAEEAWRLSCEWRLVRAVWVLKKAKTVRWLRENKRERGEEEGVRDKGVADEGRRVDIDG